MRQLARRERLSAELQRALEAKGFEKEAIEAALAFLRERNFLNDERAAKALLERRSGKRAIGRAKMRAELEAKGVAEELIETLLEGRRDSEESANALEALRSRRWLKSDRVKAARFLWSRGFEEEGIEAALDAFFGQKEQA
jgi:regulatory protein